MRNKTEKKSKQMPPFKIMFEDNDIIVVVKPAGILSVGGSGERRMSMTDMVKLYVKQQSRGNKAFAVHRLDREVLGLMLLAKSEKVKAKIITNWGNTVKKYKALVIGKPSKPATVLKDYIREGLKQKMLVVNAPASPNDPKTQLAITKYKILEEIGNYSLLDIDIETGRKNQIRVQLSNAGLPIVGDRKYGDESKFIRQIRLQAYYLELNHPITKEKIKFELPLPKHFNNIQNADENYKTNINRMYRKIEN
jgi:RluA family pseudouridine synthase